MKKIKLNNSNLYTVVDDDIYILYNKYRWYLSNGYACYGKGDVFYKSYKRLHRIIISANKTDIVDHIDGDKLNNLKSNLRIVSQRENAHNSKKRKNTRNKYKGVSYVKRIGLFQSRCRANGKDFFLGYFETDISAAYAYNKKANEVSNYILLNNLSEYSLDYLETILVTQRKIVKKYIGSKYKYISFLKKSGRMKEDKYRIIFSKNKTKYELGNFSTEEEAFIVLKNKFSYLLNDIGSLK
jgi:hypothetical protein